MIVYVTRPPATPGFGDAVFTTSSRGRRIVFTHWVSVEPGGQAPGMFDVTAFFSVVAPATSLLHSFTVYVMAAEPAAGTAPVHVRFGEVNTGAGAAPLEALAV